MTPALEGQLEHVTLGTPIAYARSLRAPGGRQYPVTERVRPAARRLRPWR